MTDNKTRISVEELKLHCTRNDLWISIHNKVYNLCEFIGDHPGGEDILLDLAGSDGSYMFEEVGHSKVARKLMETYCIGELHSH